MKDLVHFVVFRRGLPSLIAVTWGLMVGGSALLTLTAFGVARLGGGYWTAFAASVFLGGSGILFAAPVMRNAYLVPGAQTVRTAGRLFLTSVFYGFLAPFFPLYRIAYIALQKSRLERKVRQVNQEALRLSIRTQDLHDDVMKMRRQSKASFKSLPRGNSKATLFQLRTEHLRLDVRTASEETEWHLLECRKLARDLGVSLRETDTHYFLPAGTTVLRLFSVQLRATSIRV